jgi:Xaa-Pro aminopeptidase
MAIRPRTRIMFRAKFQSFEEAASSSKGAERLSRLRAELARRGLDGFVVAHADPHQNEYLPPSEERLAWLTGFSGSAGVAIVLRDKAALFVDGRYTLQARKQVDTKAFKIEHLVDRPPDRWLVDNLKEGATLGYDPWRTTIDGAERLAKAAKQAKARLVAVDDNPVDAIWTNRPAPPLGKVVLHPLKFAGEPAQKKLARIRAELKKRKLDATLLSDPTAVAWTFNIRGGDVAHTPIVLCWALLPRTGKPLLFVEARKLTKAVRHALSGLADIREPRELESVLGDFVRGRTIRLDQATAPRRLADVVEAAGGTVSKGADPVTVLKAVKNETEIAGARAAHRRDGAALVRFLAWLDRAAAKGKLSEIDAVAALETFRRDTGKLKDISFPTIAGAGPHGAIVHYRVTKETNRRLRRGELFLVDSGGQYQDGTTDVTRTVAIGNASREMRERFTCVLKGHIAIARAVFPDATAGSQVDSFARAPLWTAGLDYDHGTGHGVGSYLSVHEGPARLSKLGTAPLAAGMILSNEPGYYKAGRYGIRIENLELVVPAKKPRGGEKKLLGFESLTLAPIDRRLVEPKLLSSDERGWLDAYHARVLRELGARLDPATRKWLAAATAPLPTA